MKKRTVSQVKKDLYKATKEYRKLQDIKEDLKSDIESLGSMHRRMNVTINRLRKTNDGLHFYEYSQALPLIDRATLLCKRDIKKIKPDMDKLSKEYDKLRKEYERMTGEKFNLITS